MARSLHLGGRGALGCLCPWPPASLPHASGPRRSVPSTRAVQALMRPMGPSAACGQASGPEAFAEHPQNSVGVHVPQSELPGASYLSHFQKVCPGILVTKNGYYLSNSSLCPFLLSSLHSLPTGPLCTVLFVE